VSSWCRAIHFISVADHDIEEWWVMKMEKNGKQTNKQKYARQKARKIFVQVTEKLKKYSCKVGKKFRYCFWKGKRLGDCRKFMKNTIKNAGLKLFLDLIVLSFYKQNFRYVFRIFHSILENNLTKLISNPIHM